jgi:hypothetical protein
MKPVSEWPPGFRSVLTPEVGQLLLSKRVEKVELKPVGQCTVRDGAALGGRFRSVWRARGRALAAQILYERERLTAVLKSDLDSPLLDTGRRDRGPQPRRYRPSMSLISRPLKLPLQCRMRLHVDVQPDIAERARDATRSISGDVLAPQL